MKKGSIGASRISGQDWLYRIGVLDAGKALLQALKGKTEAVVVDTHAVQDSGVHLVEVNGVLRNVVAEVISRSVAHACLDTSAGHPHAEVAGVVVTAVVLPCQFALAIGSTPEFTAENNQRVLQHAPLLEILDQGGGRLIHIKALVLDFLGQVAVLVPAAVENLHDAHPALNQSPGQDCRVGKAAGLLDIWAIHLQGCLAFFAEVGQFRDAGLHAEGHLILGNAG